MVKEITRTYYGVQMLNWELNTKLYKYLLDE